MNEGDGKVWNASAVILDIDSGTQNESHTFSCWNDIKTAAASLPTLISIGLTSVRKLTGNCGSEV